MEKISIKKVTAFVILFISITGYSFAQNSDLLIFPKGTYTVETKTVITSNVKTEVTYHSYMHLPYVSLAVDKDYQSLNVSVPVKINGKELDAANAPILFNIKVGGYVSVNNARSTAEMNDRSDPRADFALASGYVVVTPGCRGRDNVSKDGTYYGKAPAAIVDLKAAVRYIHHNKGVIPGNTDKIVSVGCSAGGALSALLGSSGNSNLFDKYLKEIGAADEKDNIYACACYSPITDLDHSDMAYEWMYGLIPARSGLVDQKLSKQLKADFAEYQKSLNLQGKDNFGILTAENYQNYLVKYYIIPAAEKFLKELSDENRKEYLSNNKWISWKNNKANFGFADYVAHVGRMKGLPSFDGFDMQQPEPNLFGNSAIDSRHFTNFSLRYTTDNPNAEIDSDLKMVVNMMNAMYFINQKNKGCANYWWLRTGTSDNHTSQTVIGNLATSLENLNKQVNTLLFWDGGHCADPDPEGFVNWMSNITSYHIK
jgi:BD-FAE